MAQEPYPAGHLSFIQTFVQRPLTVFLPPVHRHIEPKYVKAFRDTGSIQLSSFARFKQHKDEQRGDKGEGTAFSIVNDGVKNRSFGVMTLSGGNAYVLSTTIRTGTAIKKKFGPSSFEIFDPTNFAAAVANEIPGCTQVMMGHCIYVDARTLISTGSAPTIDELKEDAEPKKVSGDKLFAHAKAIQGPKQYFLKTRVHEAQAEYRFIWETNRPVNSSVIITAPDLRKLCKF